MTKYCIIRECKNIHSWISLSGDLVFSHQQGIYGFEFPKRFLEISSRDLTLFSILSSKDLITQSLVPVPFTFARLNALQAAVTHSHSPLHSFHVGDDAIKVVVYKVVLNTFIVAFFQDVRFL